MAAFNKFENFVEDLASGVHQFHAAGHTLNCYLSNAAPNAATHEAKTDVAEITNENGSDGAVQRALERRLENSLRTLPGMVVVSRDDLETHLEEMDLGASLLGG